MQPYYQIPATRFQEDKRYRFKFVDTYEDLCRFIAADLVNRIKADQAQGKMTKVILPVGPVDYTYFSQICNREGLSCESLVIFAMDEYLDCNGRPLLPCHPLSFRGYFQRTILDILEPAYRLPDDQLIIPVPDNVECIPQLIESFGGIDVTYGGLGINGHIAFNSPPENCDDLNAFRNTTARAVKLCEADIVQFAIGGTLGNLEIVPERACTLGIKELLSAREVHMMFMRPWHAGVLRRALFGPVTAQFPGSLVQLHPSVTISMTNEAAQLPVLNVLMRAADV